MAGPEAGAGERRAATHVQPRAFCHASHAATSARGMAVMGSHCSAVTLVAANSGRASTFGAGEAVEGPGRR